MGKPSYIRHKDFLPSFVRPPPSRSGDPPWILQWAGLESSGWITSSWYWRTKRIALFFFLSAKKNIFKNFWFNEKKKKFFGFFNIFSDIWIFQRFFKFSNFWIFFWFLNFLGDFRNFSGFLKYFFGFFWIFWFFWIFGYFDFFLDFWLLRLLLKVTEVTTEHQKWPKIGRNSIIHFVCLQVKKSPLPKSEALRRS